MDDRQFALIAKALADPRRYGILSEIAAAADPLPCCGLQAAATVSAATVSHHIKALEAAELITVVRHGRFAQLGFRHATFEAYMKRLAESLIPRA